MKHFIYSKENKANESKDKINSDKVTKFLLLSSSLLVDRVFQYTNVVIELDKLGDVIIWAASRDNSQNSLIWNNLPAKVESLPEVSPFREIPHNYLRRLNEYIWDYRLQPPSRVSMMKHVREKTQRRHIKALKFPARLLAKLRLEQWIEDKIENFLLPYPRSLESDKYLSEMQPSVVVTTGPFQFEQPAIFASARKFGIPVLAYIPSWDNITTKNRLVFKYDGYLVWSEQSKKELHKFYPASKNVPVYVVGAPQFDTFFQNRFYQSREEFCRKQKLNPNLPIIVYAIGSPNFLQEHHGAIKFAERVASGEFGNVQLLVRPHPIHDRGELNSYFDKFAPLVRLQETPNANIELVERSQDEEQILEWVNTFRHADVVINLSSTVTVDAAIFDKPVINLDFDPQPSKTDQELIKDINHKWNHFKPIAESGGVWLVNSFDEMAHAVKSYLKNPSLHHVKRKWMTEYVCGYLDGKCGERMAAAINDFVKLKQQDESQIVETHKKTRVATHI